MKLDLNIQNGVRSTMPEIVEGFVVEQEAGQALSPHRLPSLEQVLKEIGPLPEEALILGMAEDGLPVLLNLWDPLPGPILVTGDARSGKTRFLQAIAGFAAATHAAGQVQYGVITADPHQWDGYADLPHCAGIFSAAHRHVTDFIRALAAWTEFSQASKQCMLLLIDGLDDFLCWNSGLSGDLQKILLQGPAGRVWPVVTMNTEHLQNTGHWLQYFHTRVFGYTTHTDAIHDAPSFGFENLSQGVEFSLKEKSGWIKFQIPGR